MVSEAMLPRAAVREVEQRLTAAGCPDADFDARELFRLATGRQSRRRRWKYSAPAAPRGNRCSTSAAAGAF